MAGLLVLKKDAQLNVKYPREAGKRQSVISAH